MTLNKQVLLAPTRSHIMGIEPPASAPERPSFGRIISDAFLQENTVVSAISAIGSSKHEVAPPAAAGYDPFDGIEGTIFEDFPEALVTVDTPDQKVRAELGLREELDRRERLLAAGPLGFAAMMAAGFLDPLILLPVGGQIKAARGMIAVSRLSKTARAAELGKVALTGTVPAEIAGTLTGGITTARAALVGATASEIVLQSSQDARTFGESAVNVTAAVFLSGLLGAGIGKISAKSRRLALEQINHDLGVVRGGTSALDDVTLTPADLIEPTGGGPNGAEIKLQNALGFENFATMSGVKHVISPFVRILVRSKSLEAKKAVMKLVDPPVRTEGFSIGSSAEAEIIEKTDGWLFEMMTFGDKQYTKYRTRIAKERGQESAFVKEGGRARANIIGATDFITQRKQGTDILSKEQFDNLAGISSRSEDSGIPEVDELATFWDERIYQPILDDGINLGLWPEEVRELGPKGARRYLSRSYLQDKLIADEPTFKSQKIRPWLLGAMDDVEIDAILKAKGLTPEKPKPGAPDPGDEGIAPMVRRSFTPVQQSALDDAIDQQVHNIFEHLTGSTRGRIEYERVRVAKGSPFKERALTWTDESIGDYLEQNISVLGERYLRTMAPDLAIMRRFGSLDLDDIVGSEGSIGKDYAAARANARTPKERTEIQAQQVEDRKLLTDMVGLLRGTYAIPPQNALVTGARIFRAANYVSMGGGFGLNSIPDIGMTVMRNGLLRSFRTGYTPLITHLQATRLSKKEAQLFGAAVELGIDSRSRVLSEVGNDFAQNRTQKVAQGIAKQMSMVNMLSPWNSMMKGVASNVTMTRSIEAIIAEGRGAASAKDIATLEFQRLPAAMRKRIRVMLETPGGMVKEGPLKWSNTRAWSDVEAAEEFGRSIRFAVDNTILTPGVGATPTWLSTEAGRTIFQFQRFGFGATNTLLLSSLQTRDLATLNGLAIMMGMGALVEWTKNQINDRPNPDGAFRWSTAAIDRSGLLGAYGQGINVGARIAGKSAMSSRFAARNVVSSMLGPTLGTAKSAVLLTNSAATGEFSDADARTLRRLLPYNQVPYFQWLFDQVEDGAVEALNLPRKRKRKRRRTQ